MLLFENETPHFFKVFLKDDVLCPRLGIPREFAINHGSRLSDSVRLKVPRGDVWEVKLERKDGGICLREGWADFVKHYGIRHGYFIVFRYDGGSRFHVIIFNMTACEIFYPVKPGGRKSCPSKKPPLLTPKSEEVESGIDQEARPCAFGGKKRKDVRSQHSPRPKKILIRGPRAINAGNVSSSLTKRELPSDEVILNGAKRKRGKFDGHLNTNSLKIHTEAAKAAGTSGALARACSYQCERPSFVVIIGRTSFYPKHYQYVPTKFLKLGILKHGVSGYMTLLVSDLKTWTVGYRNARRCTISRGWKEFVLDNYLRTGDVLVFELIRITKVTFHVVIFRDDRASQPCISLADRRKWVGVKSARESCSSRRRGTVSRVSKETPSFEAVISRRDTTNGSLYVPIHFARALARGRQTTNNVATLKVGQMSWPVQLKTHVQGSDALRTAGGWTPFVRENGLRVGDVCMFKLVDEERLAIEVSVDKK